MAVPPHPASTVLLVRDGARGVEVYVHRRPRSMRFAGGLWVYPGGRVDAADRDPAIDEHWIGPPARAWARALGVTADRARGHVVAAFRETLEECGILLATATPDREALSDARRALLTGDRTFAAVVADLGVRLDATLLRYWDWWITPPSEPIRYDTRFFLARLPSDAAITAHDDEVVDERWAGAADAEHLPMIAPTAHTLRAALVHPTVDALFATAEGRLITAVQPIIVDDHVVLPSGERWKLPSGFAEG